ncbi:hypothetical protein RHMOL_Rhmol02G0185200 [Rhododendron molle]|uniref:Uncharacterized protein n=1 Tax=Rhododendron molle TaxID=49168 RepID=A0ACC0PT12_RHOML|nr:hypothetical protein RHMOL_Rhmol02G0185200 [Rhododendron molle]
MTLILKLCGGLIKMLAYLISQTGIHVTTSAYAKTGRLPLPRKKFPKCFQI